MTLTIQRSATGLPAWHSTFAAAADIASATVHARGTLDVFTADLLTGAINLLLTIGCTNITLDFAGVDAVDHVAACSIAHTSTVLAKRHRRLTISHCRDTVQAALGDTSARRETNPGG